jgi:hypothetical protein
MKKLIIGAVIAACAAAVVFRKRSVASQLRLLEGKIDQLRAGLIK